MSDSLSPCSCEQSLRLGAELGESALLLANARDELARRDTERAPPGEVSEHAIVRNIDWTTNKVTIELKLPIALEELPSLGDEVTIGWLVPEAAE